MPCDSAYTTFVASNLAGPMPPPPAHPPLQNDENARELQATFKAQRRLLDIPNPHTLLTILTPPTQTLQQTQVPPSPTTKPRANTTEKSTTITKNNTSLLSHLQQRHAEMTTSEKTGQSRKGCPRLPVGGSRLVVKKQFLPRHLNFGGVVFGGDILTILDRAAVTAARNTLLVTRAPHHHRNTPLPHFGTASSDVCVATRRVAALSFKRPVLPRQALHVRAGVVGSWRVEGGGVGMAVVVRTFVDDRQDEDEMKEGHVGIFLVVASRLGDDDGSASVAQMCDEHSVGNGHAADDDNNSPNGDAVAANGGDDGEDMPIEAAAVDVPMMPDDGNAQDVADFYAAMALLRDSDAAHLPVSES